MSQWRSLSQIPVIILLNQPVLYREVSESGLLRQPRGAVPPPAPLGPGKALFRTRWFIRMLITVSYLG